MKGSKQYILIFLWFLFVAVVAFYFGQISEVTKTLKIKKSSPEFEEPLHLEQDDIEFNMDTTGFFNLVDSSEDFDPSPHYGFNTLADIYRIYYVKYYSEGEGYFKSEIKSLDSVHFITRNDEVATSYYFTCKSIKGAYVVTPVEDGDNYVYVQVASSIENALNEKFDSTLRGNILNYAKPISSGITVNSNPYLVLKHIPYLLAELESKDTIVNLNPDGQVIELINQPSREICEANLAKEAAKRCGAKGYKEHYKVIDYMDTATIYHFGYLRFSCK